MQQKLHLRYQEEEVCALGARQRKLLCMYTEASRDYCLYLANVISQVFSALFFFIGGGDWRGDNT